MVGLDRTNKIPQARYVSNNRKEKYCLLILTRSITASSMIKLAEEIEKLHESNDASSRS